MSGKNVDIVVDQEYIHSSEKNVCSDELKFGYGKYKPRWIQFFNRAPCLLIAISICAVCEGSIVNGFISTSISSIEKRFSLSSTQSGLFSAFYDIAVVIVLIPISHFGSKSHKGVIIATGMIILGIGSLTLILPHFLAGNYLVGDKQSILCSNQQNVQNCSETKNGFSLTWYLVLILAQLLIGFGASPLFTLGISYIDENISHNKTAIYLGVYMALSTIGPALAFIVGGQLLRIWGDIGKTDYRDLGINGPTDQRWYGAWWIGFFFVGVFSIMSAIPVYGFPKDLPEKKRNRMKDINQTHKKLDRKYGKSFREYLKTVLSLLRNPTVLTLIMMQSFEAFLMNGFITFIPKVFENLFNFTASRASTITGALVVPLGLLGSFFGAVMAKKVKRFRLMITLSIIFNSLTVLFGFIFLYPCKQLPFAGVSINYDRSSSYLALLNNTCNNHCHCSSFYNPVCNPETKISYYSPCHAGCTIEHLPENEWHNCSCLLTSDIAIKPEEPKIVIKGLCESDCSKILFFVGFSFLCFFTFASAIPIQNAALRVVSFETRDVSIGITWLFMRVTGSIPGAVIFGYAIDQTCVLWKMECGEAQSCLRYNAKALSTTMLVFALVLKISIIVCLSLSYYFYEPVYDTDPKDDSPETEGKMTNSNFKNFFQNVCLALLLL